MATSLHRVGYCNGSMQCNFAGRSRSSPAARAASASRSRARSSPKACTSPITGRSEAHLSAARPHDRGAPVPAAVETLQADVRRYDEVERAIDATVARFGGLDILINNAGVGIFADVADDDARRSGPR